MFSAQKRRGISCDTCAVGKVKKLINAPRIIEEEMLEEGGMELSSLLRKRKKRGVHASENQYYGAREKNGNKNPATSH